MKVENPIYKEVSFEKTVEDGITVFRQVLDPNIPRDDAFFEDLATIYDREENVLFQYKDIDELLAAGWVVD